MPKTKTTPKDTASSTKSTSKESPRFFALISDIHANIDALEAVLKDIGDFPVRGILCLGDIVGYGPEPGACVRRVRDLCSVSVLGNHEAMLLLADKILDEDWDVPIRKPLQIAKEQVSREELGWLRDLPITVDLDPITLSHASLNEPPEFHYIHEITEAEAHFAAQSTFISFNGHTHVPGIWEENPETFGVRCLTPGEKPVRLNSSKRYTVNVGSVGQSRDGDPRASYALYDYEQHLLLMRRVGYDLRKAQARFKKAGLPDHNSARLAKGE
jgi:diadenosine tetraphosphatase ApaH/serine/threonine PP2A family protein phosphatase